MYVSNWSDSGGQIMDMTQNYPPLPHKGNFPGKPKNNRICLKYNVSTSLLSTLMTMSKTYQIGLIQQLKDWI